MTVDEQIENKEIVAYLEKEAKWKFPPGFAGDNAANLVVLSLSHASFPSAAYPINPIFSLYTLVPSEQPFTPNISPNSTGFPNSPYAPYSFYSIH